MATSHIRSLASVVLVVAALTGRVLDEGNGHALEGVRVRAEGPTTTEATTDRTGRFTMSNMKPGPYVVTTESENVPLQEFHVTVGNGHATLEVKPCSTTYDAHCGPPSHGGGLPL